MKYSLQVANYNLQAYFHTGISPNISYINLNSRAWPLFLFPFVSLSTTGTLLNIRQGMKQMAVCYFEVHSKLKG